MPCPKHSLIRPILAAAMALGTSILSLDAHTVAIGYVVEAPGDVTVWFGTYHGPAEAPVTEGHALLTLPDNTTESVIFSLTSSTTPAGIAVGPALVISQTHLNPATHVPYTLAELEAWEGAPFLSLTEVGTYTVQLDPAFPPQSQKWQNDVGTLSFVINPFIVNGALPLGGLTPNQQGVGGAVNNAVSGGNVTNSLTVVQTALAALAASPATLGAALDQLTPLKFGNFASVTAFNNESFETAAEDMYLEDRRTGPHGTFVDGSRQLDTSGLVLNDANIDPSLQMIHSRMLAWNTPAGVSDISNSVLGGVDLKDPKQMCCTQPANLWNVFLRGNIVLGQGLSQADQPHFDDNTASVIAGVDYRISPEFLVGLVAGYAHTDATLDTSNSSATIDSYTPGIYASYSDHGWYANLEGRYTYNSYTESRNIGFLSQTANGATDGNQGMADLDGGYDFHCGKLTYGPVAGLQYTHLTVNSYGESGSDANLTVNEDQADSLRSRLGFNLKYDFHGCGVTLSPHLQATWQHEFMDSARGITSQFANFNGGAFVVRTQGTSDDFALVDAGLDAQINDRITLYGDYMVQAGQENYFGQAVQGGVKIGF